MRCDIRLMAAVATAAVLAGCAPVDPGLGEAVRYDMAAQTVDPDPAYPEDGAKPGDSGDHGAKAVERYRKGTVKEVDVQSTRSSGGGPR